MKNHEGCSRGFYRSSKAWYANLNRDRLEVNFGMYHKDGGTSGEMTMEWIELGGKQVPQLKSFSDSWSALSLFTDLIQEFAKIDSEDITEEEFVSILKKCNFRDLTLYEREDETENKLKQELFQIEKRAKEIKETLETHNKAFNLTKTEGQVK